MNPSNYCTLPIAKRLHEAGIVILTEYVWFLGTDNEWHLTASYFVKDTSLTQYPAPTLAEVWRELPENNEEVEMLIEDWLIATNYLYKGARIYPSLWIKICRDINQLCELLLWVQKQK